MCGILVDDGGDDCDTLQCHLDILASYSLTIELYPQGAEYVASVSVVVKEGKILADKVNVKEMFDVQLHEGLLTIVFELQGKTLGMLVIIIVHTVVLPIGKLSNRYCMAQHQCGGICGNIVNILLDGNCSISLDIGLVLCI